MALWKRGRRYWTQIDDPRRSHPPTALPARLNTRNNEVAGGDPARKGPDPSRHGGQARRSQCSSIKTVRCLSTSYLTAKKATANTKRAIEFDRERLEVVKRYLGDVKLSSISRELIEGFQAKRRLDGASNRTVNMDVGALRQVLKRFKHWRRLEDDVKMLTESGGAPIGRVLTDEEQERLFKIAKGNPEWEHVYCAAVLAANTSMRGVEVKHVRRKDVDSEKRGAAHSHRARTRRASE